MDFAMFSLTVVMDASSIDTRFVDWHSFVHTANFLLKCKGPWFFPCGVVPGSFDYELTLICFVHPSTKIPQFLTP